jgi:opacity protein-like surface antigen
MKKARMLLAALAAVGMIAAAAVPAAAAELDDRATLIVRINVNRTSWAACGFVYDAVTGTTYTAVLTASGIESTGAANATIVDEATDTGNPAEPCTGGGFDSQYAGMQYTLTWTSVLGTTGTLPVTCVEVQNQPVCTVSAAIV